jgi:hypothetical protein
MAEVFVSYKSGERERVQALVKALRAQALEVWWDQDIVPGAPWELTIQRELDAAKVVVVAWSNAAVVSENVVAEARRARGHGKLIQVFLDHDCEPPLFFGERQGVNLSEWTDNAADHRFQPVVAAVKAVIAGEKPPVGVGYAPKPRQRRRVVELAGGVIVLISATLGLIANIGGARATMCSLGPLRAACQSLNLMPVVAPVADPAAVAAAARQKLIQSVQGVWAPPNGSCANPITIATSTGDDGVALITISKKNGYKSTGQVMSTDTDKGVISSRNTTATADGPHAQWEYHPNGQQMTAVDKDGTSTTLVRCQTPS